MPQKKSAIKKLRQDAKKYDRNRLLKKQIRDIRKKADKALLAQKKDEAMKLYQELQKAVDKAAKGKGCLKPNTASRYKSQLLTKINALKK